MTAIFHRPVVKLGSSTLTAGTDTLNVETIADIVSQVAALLRSGMQPLIVSSGAIAAGRERLAIPDRERNVSQKQMMAAVGQSRLMHLYDRLFEAQGITTAQVLLTADDMTERRRYLNARTTLASLLDRRVVPIVNENDVVASEEIRVGDNDTLSALVAGLIDADILILVTDLPGLFTADPARYADARFVSEVAAITPEIEGYAGAPTTALGTGGMATKIGAARIAMAAGAEVRIVDGREADVITRVLNGEAVGTRFLARRDPLEARKRWILSGARSGASIDVDRGAARALLHGGASLLPAGVTGVSGRFERGDAIDIDSGGRRVGTGIVNYSIDEVRRILGRRSADIEAILGYRYGDHVVHRNDLVCFAVEEIPTHG